MYVLDNNSTYIISDYCIHLSDVFFMHATIHLRVTNYLLFYRHDSI